MKQETLEEAAKRIAYNSTEENKEKPSIKMFIKDAKWQQEQDKKLYSGEEVPNNLESVLAKIAHQNNLGLSQWYEVVYYDNDVNKWCCYSGSKTFQDGERVVDWVRCHTIF